MPAPKKEVDEEAFKKLVSEGKTNEEIAKIMGISTTTATRMRERLFPVKTLPKPQTEEEPDEGKGARNGQSDEEKQMKMDQALVTMVPTNRPLIESVIKNMSWWQQAVQEVGWRAIFLAIQTGNSEQDINRQLAGFKTADDFVNHIASILSALYDAKNDAQKLLALKEDLRDMETKADLYELYARKLEKNVNSLQTILSSIIRTLPPETAQKLAAWAIIEAYGTGSLKSAGVT